MTCVLPVPAPATTSSGPSRCVTALRCSGLRPASSCLEPVRRRRRREPRAPVIPRPGSGPATRARAPGVASPGGPRPARHRPGCVAAGGWTTGERDLQGARHDDACGPCQLGCHGRRPVSWLETAGTPRRGRAAGPRSPPRRGSTSDVPFATAFPYTRVPARAWRLLTTKPSPAWSSSASAKLWLPPVSSNGLKRTRPIRWNDRRWAASSDRGPGAQLVHLAGDRVDLVEVRVEDRLEALAGLAAGQAGEPALERRRAPEQDDDEHEEHDAGDRERDDDGTDDRGDERVQIVQQHPPGDARPSLAASPHRCTYRRRGVSSAADGGARASRPPHRGSDPAWRSALEAASDPASDGRSTAVPPRRRDARDAQAHRPERGGAGPRGGARAAAARRGARGRDRPQADRRARHDPRASAPRR